MAIANHKIRKETNSSGFLTSLSVFGLGVGGILILYYEFNSKWEQMLAIVLLYLVLAFGARIFSMKKKRNQTSQK
jgi:Ca2+/Na+ antiporter